MSTDTIEEKKPKEYSAEQYLRFTLKSSQLITHLADHLDILREKFTKAGINPDKEAELRKEYTPAGAHQVAQERLQVFLNDIEQASARLREFVKQAKEVYTHDANAADQNYMGGMRNHLMQARATFHQALADRRLASVDLITNGQIANDMAAIDKRLLPVFKDDNHLRDTLREYRQKAPVRMAQATSGKLPDGLDKVATTIFPPHPLAYTPKLSGVVVDYLQQSPKPQVEHHRRPLTKDASGKVLTGAARYQHLKSQTAESLLAQGLEAEKTRNGEGAAFERREIERLAKEAEKEPQR